MYKKGIFLAISFVACAFCAQGKENLDKEDLLAAFQQYNPTALENASAHPAYGEILYKLAEVYQLPDTIENQTEMIALVKNFDNSLQLHALQQAYQQGRTLQAASGASLEALNTNIEQAVEVVLRDVYRNTVFAKQFQIKAYKQKIKDVKKAPELSAEQKKEQVAQWKAKVKQTKQELASLKKNADLQIANTARQYMQEMRTDYEQAQTKQLQALQSKTHNVKADHKKPVAK